MTIAAILRQKGDDVAHVAPDATIAEVVKALATRRIGAVLVLDADRQVLGIVSERDIVGRLAEHGTRTLDMTASQVMTRHLKTAAPSTSVAEATEMMTNGRFRHLPVMDGERLLGIVSIGDIVKARLSQQEHDMDNLKAYVAGAA